MEWGTVLLFARRPTINILELFARIGLKADQGPADAFLKTVKGIQGELVGAIAGTLSLAAAVKAMNGAMAQALEFKKFSAETGASAQELQKWANVADQVSGSGDAVAASIRAITSNQEAIKLGKGNISGYQLLGIDPRSDPFAVLEKLRGKLQGLSPAMRRNVASQFGISPDLVMTLELTNDEFDKMAARAWIIPQSSINGLNKARAALSEVKNAFNFIQAELATKFAPVIEKVTKWVINFALMVERAVLMLDKIIRGTIGWKAALAVLVGVLAILNASFLLSPIGLFTIAILALMAILEDLYVFSTGGDSLFGLLVDEFPALGKAFDWVVKLVENIKELFSLIGKGDWKGLDELTDKWGILGDIIDGIVGGIRFIIEGLKNPLGSFEAFGKDVREGGIGQALSNDFSKFVGEVQGFFGLSGATPATAGATTIAPTVIINGVTEPAEAGAAAAREVERVIAGTQASRARTREE